MEKVNNKYGNRVFGSKTGLISKRAFESNYKYYYISLENRDRSNVSGLSLYCSGLNNTQRNINLTFIVIYEKYAMVDCISGKYK